MKENEKQLFKELCKCKSNKFETKYLAYATPHVLGQLFFNRMHGVAYGTLQKFGLLGSVNREFRNSLRGAYEQNLEKNQSFFQGVELISEILSQYDRRTALLKGAYLCAYYPAGYRTSNDIDILMLPQDVTEIGNALRGKRIHSGESME